MDKSKKESRTRSVKLIENYLTITMATDTEPPRPTEHQIHYYKLESSRKKNNTLIILHGALSCASQYIRLAHKLTTIYEKIYLIDIPGFGVTKALPNQDLSKTAFSVFLILQKVHQINKPEKNKMDVVGHSYGAYLLQESLTKHPSAIRNINKVVLTAVACLYPKLHLQWYNIWRTYFWAFFFKYRVVTGLVRFLAQWLPEKTWCMLTNYYPTLKLWQNSIEGEYLLSNSITTGKTCCFTNPSYLQIANLSKKLKLYLLWGENDYLFTVDIARKFAKEHNIILKCISRASHQPLTVDIKVGAAALKQILAPSPALENHL